MSESITLDMLRVCGVCGGSLQAVVDLPALPLTGIFVTDHEDGRSHGYDQKLMKCVSCGHAQLDAVLAPGFLYGNHYAHRSSASHLTPSATQFIVGYLDAMFGDRRFSTILEIGCNDLVLLNKLAPRAERVVGIDPLWIGKTPTAVTPNMTVIGSFVEDVDFERDVGTRPDLIVSTHNLEHIVDPLTQVKRLLDFAADDAVVVMEVPDYGCMVRNLRFDQVFHQHVHYFGLSSFLELVRQAGAHYVHHAYNWRNWGGSLTVAFSRDASLAKPEPAAAPLPLAFVESRYALYRDRMKGLLDLLQGLDGEIWAYGAAQMLPTFAYHLGSDLGFLAGIYDDCPKRTGLTYPTIRARIHKPDASTSMSEATVVITALDAVRPIANRLRDFNPKFIVTPSQVF